MANDPSKSEPASPAGAAGKSSVGSAVPAPHLSMRDDHARLWQAVSQIPGVGVSITDTQGRLLFLNATAMFIFEGRDDIEYQGKTIADFHTVEFVAERLRFIRQVVSENRPLRISHFYLGRRISSTVLPIQDLARPFDRVMVVSQVGPLGPLGGASPEMDEVESEFVELGPLESLTPRELEVLVMLGHGLSIPSIAAQLHRSTKTVERHKEAIGEKLRIRRHADLVRMVTLVGLTLEDAFKPRLHEATSILNKIVPALPEI